VSTIAILLTVWIMDENSLFPGFWALIPTLGAVCILQAGMDSYLNANLLASKPFVFIGKISYPLYLWHWPLLVFSRYLYPSGSKSIFANTFFIVGLAVLLSVLTYHFVENKIRYRKTTKVVILLVIGMALVGLSALIIYKNANFYNEKTSL
jgi:peptidoglycan/LPS O-acetylase OafA/YrhL